MRYLVFVVAFGAAQLCFADQDCKNAQVSKVEENPQNRFSFFNYSSNSSVGHCWAMSHLHSNLLAGAHFAEGQNAQGRKEDIGAKLKQLDQGIPVTFTSVSSIKELTRKYEAEVKEYLEKKQSKIEHHPGSYLGTGYAWITSPGNKGQAKKIVKMLRAGKRPIIGIANGGAHSVLAEDFEERPNGDIVITVVDSNSPVSRMELICRKSGKCDYPDERLSGGTISVVPPFFPNEKKLAEKRCEMLAGKSFKTEKSRPKRRQRIGSHF